MRLQWWRKALAALAAFVEVTIVGTGAAATAGLFLTAAADDQSAGSGRDQTLVILAAVVSWVLVAAIGCLLLYRAALSRHRMRGSMRRIVGRLMVTSAVGAAIGCTVFAFLLPLAFVMRIAALLIAFALAVAAVLIWRRMSRRTAAPMRAAHGPARVADHWSGPSRLPMPELYVVEFVDPRGTIRSVIDIVPHVLDTYGMPALRAAIAAGVQPGGRFEHERWPNSVTFVDGDVERPLRFNGSERP